jgi:hypothetical protein
MTTITRAGNVNAQYESPVRCRATSRKAMMKAPAPIPMSNLLEMRWRRRPAKICHPLTDRYPNVDASTHVYNNPTDSCWEQTYGCDEGRVSK